MDGLDLLEILSRELSQEQVSVRKANRAAESGRPSEHVRDLFAG